MRGFMKLARDKHKIILIDIFQNAKYIEFSTEEDAKKAFKLVTICLEQAKRINQRDYYGN